MFYFYFILSVNLINSIANLDELTGKITLNFKGLTWKPQRVAETSTVDLWKLKIIRWWGSNSTCLI